jgi:hypothetical protein
LENPSLIELWLDFPGLVAQSIHEHYQARWHPNRLAVEICAQSLGNFVAERHAMDMADLTVALGRGVSHGIPICCCGKVNRNEKKRDKNLAMEGHQTCLVNLHAGIGVSQTGCGEIRPDLGRAINDSRADLEPVTLDQNRALAGFHTGGEAWQRNHGSSEEQQYRQGGEGFDHFALLTFASQIPLRSGMCRTTTIMRSGSGAATYICGAVQQAFLADLQHREIQ